MPTLKKTYFSITTFYSQYVKELCPHPEGGEDIADNLVTNQLNLK